MLKIFTIWYRTLPSRKQRAVRTFLWAILILFVGAFGFLLSGSARYGWFR